MSPERTASGYYRFAIDLRRLGLGKVRVSSRTKNAVEFARREQIIRKLARDESQIDVLRAFVASRIQIEQLVAADRDGKLGSAGLMVDLAIAAPLWAALDGALPRMGKGATRARYATSRRKLARVAADLLPANAIVADLARVDWPVLREAWGGSAADWNHLRRMVSRFLTVALGDVYHPFRRKVMGMIPLRSEAPRVTDLSVDLFHAIMARVPDHARACYYVLALTGMRVGEYLRCTRESIRPDAFGVAVPGTKTEESAAVVYVAESLWPWITAGIPAPLGYKWMREYFKRAVRELGHDDLILHDLRHCFGQYAINEGVAQSKVQKAMRHADPKMTANYVAQKDKREVADAIERALYRPAPTRGGWGAGARTAKREA